MHQINTSVSCMYDVLYLLFVDVSCVALINVGDNRFFKSIHEEQMPATKEQQEQTHKLASYGKSNPDFKRPQYSLSVAHSLSVASKLAYEDVAVVKYELEKAGYDVEHTFKAIGYKVGVDGLEGRESITY